MDIAGLHIFFFMKIKILTVVVFLFSFPAWSQDDQARTLLKKMLDACDDVRSAKFILNSTERELNGKMERSEIIIKMQTAPLKIYLYMIHPNPGAECLWKKDESNNRVLVNPNGFPYVNLKLSPYNSLLRQDSHHLIPEIGFNYIASMTKYYMNKMSDSFFSYLQLTDTLLWDNRTCYELTFDFTSFQYVDYTVKMSETLTSIAAQFHLSDFVLLRSNRKVSDYDFVKPGQVIKIPNFYNRKIVFYIDHLNYLPLVQTVYDEKGLFEKYELKSFILNPVVQPEEFQSSYPDYGF